MAARGELLDRVLDLSRRMTTAGEAGEWEQVVALEAERSPLLTAAFDRTEAVAPVEAGQIQAILACDKQLMGLTLTARDGAAAELGQLQRGRKGTQAYQSAGR